MPGLLMIGDGPVIVSEALLATIGVTGLSIAFAGWLGHRLSAAERIGFVLASLLVLIPLPVAVDAVNLMGRGLGSVTLALLALRCWRMPRTAGTVP
jgi:TRAP-type uncharacterized transport system fused permease subunit